MSTLEPMKINSLMAKGNELQNTVAPIIISEGV